MHSALTKLPSVVLIGRTNVGKSTLFNRLLGRRRNIAHNEPAVTRDFLEGIVNADTQPFRLIDTAGFEPAPKWSYPEVQQGLRRTLGTADIFLYVIDGREDVNPIDQDAIRELWKQKKPLVIAVNKIDHPTHELAAYRFHELGVPTLVFISAEHDLGMAELIDTVQEKIPLFPSPLPQRGPVGAGEGQGEGSPIKLAIVGRPNVGKSSMTNALCGRERMVVSPQSGTTRDAVEVPIVVSGKDYVVMDTAGIRRAGKRDSVVERASVSQALYGIGAAEVVIWMLDADEGIVEQDKRVLSEILELKKPFVAVFNKWDLVLAKNKAIAPYQLEKKYRKLFISECGFASYAPVYFSSAVTGSGAEELFMAIGELYRESHIRFTTNEVNQHLEAILANHPIPTKAGKSVRIYYATQTRTAPPTFVFFANNPTLIHFSYRRYLENAIREHFPFKHVPIQVVIRGRKNNE